MSNREKRAQAEKEKAAVKEKIKAVLQRAGRKGTKRRERKNPLDMVRQHFPGGWRVLDALGYSTSSALDTWEPKGKGKKAIFKSLIDHLMVKYPPPTFLYRTFYNAPQNVVREELEDFGKFFRHLAWGGSLRKLVGTNLLPTPLTKRMCHEFLSLPAHTPNLVAGVRTVQVKTYGGSPSMRDAIVRSRLGRFMRDEEFWATVVQWFCNQAMLDTRQVGPLVDFIMHCRNEDHNFSMKGRTALAMIRNMEEWHGVLHRLKGAPTDVYEQSGLLEGTWITKKVDRQTGMELKHVWIFKELTSAKELMQEGRAMRHCVYSYARSVQEGYISIWSLRKDEERILTIEVDNRSETIRQVRGFGNRWPAKEEMHLVNQWATKNRLRISAWGL